jgi:DNA-binding MurR/RpiR family transcriptional regulator
MKDNLKELKERIKEKIPYLTNSQKTIANYIVENPRRFAVSSIRELEEELGISKSTIVRLAQALGYEGFYELRNVFLKSIRHELDPIYRYKSFLTEQFDESDILVQISDESVRNINTTLNLLDREQFQRAITILEKSQHVFTMGLGVSAYLAELAAYLLNRVSIKATPMIYGGLTFAEQIINLSGKDAVLAFSFPPYSEETIHAAEYAAEKKIPVIGITDKVTNPLVRSSEAFLQVSVETSAVSNSIVSVIVLLYAMITAIGRDLKDRALETIRSIEHVRKEHSGRKS